MIPNHAQFLAAIADRKKVCVRFYSKPDNGVLDRVCAPMDYGPGEIPDGLHRYWLWDDQSETGTPTMGLLPQQILDLRVLGELFDPAKFQVQAAAPPEVVTPAVAPLVGGDKGPVL